MGMQAPFGCSTSWRYSYLQLLRRQLHRTVVVPNRDCQSLVESDLPGVSLNILTAFLRPRRLRPSLTYSTVLTNYYQQLIIQMTILTFRLPRRVDYVTSVSDLSRSGF